MAAIAAPLFAGVELGGTKCICTLGYGPSAVEDQVTLPTGHPDDTLGAIATQLERWRRRHDFAALGIGSFGPLSLDVHAPDYGRIQRTAKPGWTGAAVLERVVGTLDVPVRLDTDVNAAALAERRWGAGGDARDVAYVTVGTGIGVGFAPVAGADGVVHAEFGHVRVVREPGDSRPSACPFHGDCVEGLASGRAITLGMSPAEVEALSAASPQWEAPIAYLGQLCHAIMCATGVSRIVFGGGAMTKQPALIARIEAAMRASLNDYLVLPDTPVLHAAALGNQAGPLGSLALADLALGAASRPVRQPALRHG